VVGGAELLLRAERRVEVVLGAGSVQAWGPGLVVDEDHVVALAVPVVELALEDVDVEVAAHVVAASPGVEDHVVALAREVRLLPGAAHREAGAHGPLLAQAVVLAPVALLAPRARRDGRAVPPGVEARQLRIDRRVRLVVDVVEEDAQALALVL
jgi:hypothetical protein